jgi:cbb3-type cytochrome oxidase maturation protein
VTSLLLLIPLSVLVLIGAGIALFWAINRGQFDDLETPALLPLLDSDEAPKEKK